MGAGNFQEEDLTLAASRCFHGARAEMLLMLGGDADC